MIKAILKNLKIVKVMTAGVEVKVQSYFDGNTSLRVWNPDSGEVYIEGDVSTLKLTNKKGIEFKIICGQNKFAPEADLIPINVGKDGILTIK